MKTIKRFLSIALVLAMVMSSSAVAFAAETSGSDVSADAEMVSILTENYAAANDSDEGIAPQSLIALTDVMRQNGVLAGGDITGQFINDIPSRQNITIAINTTAAVTVYVTYGTTTFNRYIPAGQGNYTICQGQGRGNRFSFRIHFHDYTQSIAAQFFATDGDY